MLPLLCLLAGLAATVTGACDTPFKVVGEGCYYFSWEDGIDDTTWQEANQYCQSMGSEVDLAVLGYVCDDYGNLLDYLQVQATFFGLRNQYLGATGGGDTWYWLDGRSFSTGSTYWHTGRPTLSSGCVLVGWYNDGINPMRRNIIDLSCDYQGAFICQDFSAALQQ